MRLEVISWCNLENDYLTKFWHVQDCMIVKWADELKTVVMLAADCFFRFHLSMLSNLTCWMPLLTLITQYSDRMVTFFVVFFDGTINLPCWLLVVLCCSRHLHIIIKVKLWQHCFAIISQLTKAKDHWDWVFFYMAIFCVTFGSKK